MDSVFRSVVDSAIKTGYKLIDYDSNVYSPNEPSLRDIIQRAGVICEKKAVNIRVTIAFNVMPLNKITTKFPLESAVCR